MIDLLILEVLVTILLQNAPPAVPVGRGIG